MSGAFARFGGLRTSLPRLGGRRVFSVAGQAGPRRIVIVVAAAAAIMLLIVVVATSGRQKPLFSRDARMGAVDALPGGLHTTPEQNALAYLADTSQAAAARSKGQSYTPPMAPSQPVLATPPRPEQAAPELAEIPQPGAAAQPTLGPRPVFVGKPEPFPRPMVPQPLQPPVPIPASVVAPEPRAIPIAATTPDPNADQAYHAQINQLFSQWGGHMPRTDVVLPPPEDPSPGAAHGSDAQGTPGTAATGTARDGASALPVAMRPANAGDILVPAGRGIYAHPILAVSSDASAPVVLQADSGPIAGDRMIGTFARQDDRLVIHVNTVIHQGENIGTDGLVIAPGSMEVGVASNVDQHYLSRFLLPAAAAFVAGLGQAIEQTSNTQSVLSPFGGAAYATHLNLSQQLGVGAGAAASQIGSTLSAAAPKGPTVSLEPNVAVGVMFLSNVTAHHQQ